MLESFLNSVARLVGIVISGGVSQVCGGELRGAKAELLALQQVGLAAEARQEAIGQRYLARTGEARTR